MAKKKPAAKPKAKKPVAKAKSELPKVPEEVSLYLQDDCCNEGIIQLHRFVSDNPALAGKAILKTIAPRMSKCRKEIQKKVKEAMNEIMYQKNELEKLTGKPVEITTNIAMPKE